MAGKESITRLEFYFTGLPLFLKRNSRNFSRNYTTDYSNEFKCSKLSDISQQIALNELMIELGVEKEGRRAPQALFSVITSCVLKFYMTLEGHF